MAEVVCDGSLRSNTRAPMTKDEYEYELQTYKSSPDLWVDISSAGTAEFSRFMDDLLLRSTE